MHTHVWISVCVCIYNLFLFQPIKMDLKDLNKGIYTQQTGYCLAGTLPSVLWLLYASHWVSCLQRNIVIHIHSSY